MGFSLIIWTKKLKGPVISLDHCKQNKTKPSSKYEGCEWSKINTCIDGIPQGGSP